MRLRVGLSHCSTHEERRNEARKEYYPSAEVYLEGRPDAMHEEYKAIVDAGFLLQIDDPDLADAW